MSTAIIVRNVNGICVLIHELYPFLELGPRFLQNLLAMSDISWLSIHMEDRTFRLSYAVALPCHGRALIGAFRSESYNTSSTF